MNVPSVTARELEKGGHISNRFLRQVTMTLDVLGTEASIFNRQPSLATSSRQFGPISPQRPYNGH